MAHFQETKARDDQRAGADLVESSLGSRDTDMLAQVRVPKERKPYMITKQREKWSEDEHNLFLEALQLYGRSWRRIQEHIGTKTAVQIRSHAQKFFTKVIRESSGDNSNSSGTALSIQIPPPRPKKKSVHPYPCNQRKASGKHVHTPPQLEKPQQQTQTHCEQENSSPRSELTTSHIDSETFGSDDSDRSPASTIDVEERCPTPSIATAELSVQVPPTNVKGAKDDTTSKEEGWDRSEVPVLKLFGKSVVVNDLQQHPKSDNNNLQTVADMELDGSAETPSSGTAKFSSNGATEANTCSRWPTNIQQFMYYLPPGAVFFSYIDGSMPCPLLSNPMTAASNQQHHHQHSEAVDQNLTSEASLPESNKASCGVPETVVHNSESYKKANGSKDKTVPVSVSRKSLGPTSTSRQGFMPYKRCTAESKVRQSLVPGDKADGEMTRLCL